MTIDASWVDVIVVVLGAWRVTRLVVADDFPPVARARDWVLERWPTDDTAFLGSAVVDPESDVTTTKHGVPVNLQWQTGSIPVWFPTADTAIGKLISCVWCAGFWVSALTVAAWWLIPVVAVPVLAVFAVSAAVGFVNRFDT